MFHFSILNSRSHEQMEQPDHAFDDARDRADSGGHTFDDARGHGVLADETFGTPTRNGVLADETFGTPTRNGGLRNDETFGTPTGVNRNVGETFGTPPIGVHDSPPVGVADLDAPHSFVPLSSDTAATRTICYFQNVPNRYSLIAVANIIFANDQVQNDEQFQVGFLLSTNNIFQVGERVAMSRTTSENIVGSFVGEHSRVPPQRSCSPRCGTTHCSFETLPSASASCMLPRPSPSTLPNSLLHATAATYDILHPYSPTASSTLLVRRTIIHLKLHQIPKSLIHTLGATHDSLFI